MSLISKCQDYNLYYINVAQINSAYYPSVGSLIGYNLNGRGTGEELSSSIIAACGYHKSHNLMFCFCMQGAAIVRVSCGTSASQRVVDFGSDSKL